jgi:hypothetical protein
MFMNDPKEKNKVEGERAEAESPSHEHAWKGTWKRPMKLDEKSLHPFTVARMTDHNVRGSDEPTDSEKSREENTQAAKSESSDLKSRIHERDRKKSA